jgi:hypothetical protein
MHKEKEDEYFSDEDAELYSSNHDKNKFVILSSNKLNYGILDTNEVDDSKELNFLAKQEQKMQREQELEDCFIEMNDYCRENSLQLFDKSKFLSFINFCNK